MSSKSLCSLLMTGALLFGAAPSVSAASPTPAELKPVLEQILRENPEIILDFLREHCEAVLDIAQRGSDQRRLANLEKQWAQDAKVEKKVRLENRPRIGAADAKVRIIAFSDFTCNYCLRAEKTLEELLDEYAGRVSFVFKNMPLETDSVSGLASQYYIAIAQLDEEQAWKFYKIMFRQRDELMSKGEEFIRATAAAIGVDMKKLDAQRKNKSVGTILREDLKDADDLHIEGTPYFLVNNLVIRGAVAKDLFRRAIEIELAK